LVLLQLKGVIEDKNLQPDQIFSIDETGIQHGKASKAFKYLVARGERTLAVTQKCGA